MTATRWVGLALAGAMVALLITGLVTRSVASSQVTESTFQTSPMGLETPTDIGIDYQQIEIVSGDRVLQSWWIPAEDATGSVLAFHGQNEALSDWTWAAQRINDAGLNLLVFDYSGFGDSTGEPNVANLREDASATYAEFEVLAGDEPTYLLGYSMGGGVLLDAIVQEELTADEVVVVSSWSSIRDVAVNDGDIPHALRWAVPNVYNSVANARSVDAPMHVVISETDGRFPVWMSEDVAEAGQADIVVTPTPGHSDFLAGPSEIGDAATQLWNAVLEPMVQAN